MPKEWHRFRKDLRRPFKFTPQADPQHGDSQQWKTTAENIAGPGEGKLTDFQNYHIVRLKCFSSVQSVVSDSLWLHEQHARPPCPSPTTGVHSNSGPSSWWCHPAISSSVGPFSCRQSLPASGSFPMSQLFAWGSQSIGVSALASDLPMNTQDWSPLGWTGWISLQSKGLSKVFSNTTVQKHQFFSAQLSSQSQLSHPYMTTRKTSLD